MKFGFFSRNLRNPLLIALAIIAIAIGGSFFMHQRAPVAQAPQDAQLVATEPVAPDYSVTSSPAIRHEDELTGQVRKTVYKCANGEYFTARTEVDGTRAEIFLKDYSKILVMRTSADAGTRYANTGGSFSFTTNDNTAFIEESEGMPYPDCIAQ